VTPFEFRQDLWRQKTKVPGVVCVILRLAVLIQYRRVTTDGQTDRHTTTAKPALAMFGRQLQPDV